MNSKKLATIPGSVDVNFTYDELNMTYFWVCMRKKPLMKSDAMLSEMNLKAETIWRISIVELKVTDSELESSKVLTSI